MLLKRPITIVTWATIGVTMVWVGYILLTLHMPPGQAPPFSGARTFAPLDVWGWLFIGGGMLNVFKIVLVDRWLLTLLTHLPVLAINVAWALALDQGPKTVGQAIFTFFAVFVALSPFIPRMMLWSIKTQGFFLMRTGTRDLTLEDYHELPYYKAAQAWRAEQRKTR